MCRDGLLMIPALAEPELIIYSEHCILFDTVKHFDLWILSI